MDKEIKILYVDDEKINLLIFRKLFEKDYTVITAEDGMKGLEILQKEPNIDFVISDMKMPLKSGIDFIKEANEIFDDKKYFILTGYSINNEIQDALDSGLIIQSFTKPANFDKISKVLDKNL